MPSLAELLDVRAKGLEQERNTPKPVPLREHRDYAKYSKWLEEGKFTLGELSTQLLHAGLDNRALEMDPSKPYGWKPSDAADGGLPFWKPPPVVERFRQLYEKKQQLSTLAATISHGCLRRRAAERAG